MVIFELACEMRSTTASVSEESAWAGTETELSFKGSFDLKPGDDALKELRREELGRLKRELRGVSPAGVEFGSEE